MEATTGLIWPNFLYDKGEVAVEKGKICL